MCVRIAEPTNDFTPPLRLVLNSNCNGNCSFCHHEGHGAVSIMDQHLVFECAEVAEQLKIPHISLTGGEPTLRTDLGSLVAGIQSRYNGKLSLTTNGFGLSKLSHAISIPLHTVNLSIASFREDVYRKYQNVNPYDAIQSVISFPAINKNVNIVVVKENYLDIKEITEYCLRQSLPVHIMFELKDYSPADKEMQEFVMRELRKFGQSEVKSGTTPTLIIKTKDRHIVSVKHPNLSRRISWNICRECDVQESCFERVCAIRVYANGIVTPCLNGHIKLSEGSVVERIVNIYKMFAPCHIIAETTCNGTIDVPYLLQV